ncbi:sigma-70 family RNA polymerase sigma factor [Tissierella sp. Yu-01]|uniref:RNA polymerase sigma factor n=1 Tax=Tissierella sp. Yu-01 TaxID=3035694 RepID=UPI00240E46EE|nr:sigma-70 family RNA polymerase sigma factor [Tissierella sp. Yu-01]WFA09013.1 sigma-70 family RNA polymerase sigma factor [Tissierella sp. Yu-01]
MNMYDTRQIEDICKNTWEPLYRYIYYRVQNREEAEDITQETYAKSLSYSKLKDIEPDKYIAFFKTVALNIIRDKWRKNKKGGNKVNIEAINPMEIAVDDAIEKANQELFINNALKKLNDDQRQVIELRIIKGYSVSETAKIMGKTEGNIRVLQYRALKNLAEIIDEEKE